MRGSPVLPADVRGVLDIDGVGFAPPVIVKLSEDASPRLELVLDPTTAARFSGTLDRLEQRRAA